MNETQIRTKFKNLETRYNIKGLNRNREEMKLNREVEMKEKFMRTEPEKW